MKNWARNLLKYTSLSTALFIFQACYGMHNWHGDCSDVLNCHYRKI